MFWIKAAQVTVFATVMFFLIWLRESQGAPIPGTLIGVYSFIATYGLWLGIVRFADWRVRRSAILAELRGGKQSDQSIQIERLRRDAWNA